MSYIYTRIATNGDQPGSRLMLWCPGCDDVHQIGIDTPDGWTWNGDRDCPDISPSILVRAVQWAPGHTFHRPNHNVGVGERTICHSFVRGGHWEFLNDSTHILAGKRVLIVPFPEDFSE